MRLLIQFEEPLRISQSKDSLDSLQIRVLNTQLFVSANGIDTIEQGYTASRTLPKMMGQDGKPHSIDLI
jgi:hypothetical protein